MATISLVKFNRFFLDLSWNWLNDPEIKQMTNTSDFTKEMQIIWFDRIDYMCNYSIWGIQYNDLPIGVCGLKNITLNDCEYWGYIGEKIYWGIRLGSAMIKLMEEKAKEYGLKSIWLSVMNDNERALKLYKKNSFSKERVIKNLIIMRKIL